MRAGDVLDVRTVLFGDAAVVSLSGELDLATGPLVTDAVTRALAGCPGRLDVDVTGLVFCDAAGLRALSYARRAARLHGAVFRLVGVRPRLRRMFAVLRAGDLVPPAPV